MSKTRRGRNSKMPTYEYKCENCKHFFEQFQPITANPLKKCPECGKMKLNRLIGIGAAVIFKGNGFYETDYRNKSYTEQANKEKSESKPATEKTKSESNDNTKADTKKLDTKPKKISENKK